MLKHGFTQKYLYLCGKKELWRIKNGLQQNKCSMIYFHMGKSFKSLTVKTLRKPTTSCKQINESKFLL